MTTQTDPLKLALKALQSDDYWTHVEAVNAIHKALAQPEHLEPVAWMSKDADIVYASIQVDGCFHNDHIPLYTTTPQRTWAGLTPEEIDEIEKETWDEDHKSWGIHDFAKAIEAKLKAKNSL